MPKCSHCEKPQGRLNKGALCKECFRNKINGDINKHTSQADGDLEFIDDDILKELDVYDLIKENMAQEKRHNLEIINLMEDQIELLRNEITHKNTLIETLSLVSTESVRKLTEIPNRYFFKKHIKKQTLSLGGHDQ